MAALLIGPVQHGEFEQSSPAMADLSAAVDHELCEQLYCQFPLR
jgi:hypothetical protein